MSATDELRRMLDERGVAHSDHYLSTTWRDGHGILHLAGEPMADGSLVVDMLTPEQAIAATLGSDREAELQKALNKAAGNWARADAGLRKALDFMRIWISEDAHLGESAISREFEKAEGLRKLGAIEDAIAATLGGGMLTAEQVREAWCGNLKRDCLYDPPTPDWQAIADELNARAERTCKQEERGWGTEGDHARVWLTCGHDCMVPTVQDLPNYCPNCGAKVVEP